MMLRKSCERPGKQHTQARRAGRYSLLSEERRTLQPFCTRKAKGETRKNRTIQGGRNWDPTSENETGTKLRLRAIPCYRRAAHFAHFAQDEEEEEENAHVGGTEVCPSVPTIQQQSAGGSLRRGHLPAPPIP